MQLLEKGKGGGVERRMPSPLLGPAPGARKAAVVTRGKPGKREPREGVKHRNDVHSGKVRHRLTDLTGLDATRNTPKPPHTPKPKAPLNALGGEVFAPLLRIGQEGGKCEVLFPGKGKETNDTKVLSFH